MSRRSRSWRSLSPMVATMVTYVFLVASSVPDRLIVNILDHHAGDLHGIANILLGAAPLEASLGCRENPRQWSESAKPSAETRMGLGCVRKLFHSAFRARIWVRSVGKPLGSVRLT